MGGMNHQVIGTDRLGAFKVEHQYRPNLCIDFFQQKRESFLCNLDLATSDVNQAATMEQCRYTFAELDSSAARDYIRAANHVTQDTFPLLPRKLVELFNGNLIITWVIARYTKGFMISASGERQA